MALGALGALTPEHGWGAGPLDLPGGLIYIVFIVLF